MTSAGAQELIEAIRRRYVGAGNTEQGRILDEAVRVTNWTPLSQVVGYDRYSSRPARRTLNCFD